MSDMERECGRIATGHRPVSLQMKGDKRDIYFILHADTDSLYLQFCIDNEFDEAACCTDGRCVVFLTLCI